MEQTGEWIRNADAKTGLLLTALTVLLAAIGSQARALRMLWTRHPNVHWSLWVLGASVLLLAVAYLLLIAVLLPRTKSSASSRFAWPWIAATSEDDLQGLSERSVRQEAWRQAKALAGIARTKYWFFKLAVCASAGSTLTYLVWTIVRP